MCGRSPYLEGSKIAGMDPTRFQMGVNYWPRRKAMYWWSEFDAGEVRVEFEMIRELNLNLVRIFLLWEDWQRAPEQVDVRALASLETVLLLAADLELELDITFFVGHMSGPSWIPEWMLAPEPPPITGRPPVGVLGKAGEVRLSKSIHRSVGP